jgi:hypothetical protein
MAFTASVMNRLKVYIDTMFADPKLVNSHLNQPAMTARALLENQTAMADPILKGGKCVGVTAWFIDSSGTTEVSASTDCTTPGGTELSTDSKDYTTSVLGAAARTAKDNRCDNEIDFIQEMGAVTLAVISDLRRQLNEYALAELDAGAQTSIDNTGIPSTWDATGSAPEIIIPKSEATWDNLGYLHLMAELNNIGPFITISGAGSFWGEWWKSNYQRFNNNEVGIFQAFADQGFYFDARQMDQILGRSATFLVGVNNYIFWNTTFSPAVPTEFSVGSNGKKFVFTQPDPVLTYMDNGVRRPVMYEIEMEEACSARNSATNQLQKSYKVYGRIVGGLELAPVGPQSETGVLTFTTQSGI